MLRRTTYVFTAFAVCLAVAIARGQEARQGDRVPGSRSTEPEPTGPEKKYYDLSHSSDSRIKALAERYLHLIRYQEWGTASGKSVLAKYVSHEPDLSRVKLAVPKGTGKDRTVKEYDVEVEKLNKAGQFRVKQIDALQKKLDELAAAATKGNPAGGPPGPGGPLEGPGNARGQEAPNAGPGAAPPNLAAPGQSQVAEPDPSAAEPDPLGFAELPPVAAAAPIGPGVAPMIPSAATTGPSGSPPGAPVDRNQWRSNIAGLVANITVSTDPTGKPQVDWGELRELREMNDLAIAHQSPGAAPRSPEAETPAAISERLGDVHWHVIADKVEQAPGGMVNVQFRAPELPKPLEVHIVLDNSEDVQKWSKTPPGTLVNVTGRLTISEPYKITAKVKLANSK